MSSPSINARQPVVLQIAGQRLRLNANGNEEHLAQLAEQLNSRCDKMQRDTRSTVQATALALVALDLIDEISALRRKADELEVEHRRQLLVVETRAREIESLARRAVVEALGEIDRALELDANDKQHDESESESA